MPEPVRFNRELFRFLRDLDQNNDRNWFQQNRDRFESHLKQPALDFIIDFARPLAEISPHFRADPRLVGGSLFRIYRDTRFSHDKSPYKTHCGIQFRHRRGKDVHSPCYYVHLEPSGSFIGAGLWHPATPTLRLIRDAIVADPDRWLAVTGEAGFAARFRLKGDSLKRVPREYPKDHPLGDDLRRKDFIAVTDITQKDVLAADFVDRVALACRDGAPLMEFLCEAVGVEY